MDRMLNEAEGLRPISQDGESYYNGWMSGLADFRAAVDKQIDTQMYYIDTQHGADGYGYPLESGYGTFAFNGHLFVTVENADGTNTAYHLFTSSNDYGYGVTWNVGSETDSQISQLVDISAHKNVIVGEEFGFGDIHPTFQGKVTSITAVVGDPRRVIDSGAIGYSKAVIGKFYNAA